MKRRNSNYYNARILNDNNIKFQNLKMSRGMSAGGGDGSVGEILRLRKELVHAKTQITDLQEELQEKTTLYIQAINVRKIRRQTHYKCL
jgi:hypothetical protein